MNHYTKEDAFAENAAIENLLTKNESVSYTDVLDKTLIAEIREFCIDFLKIESFDVFDDTSTPRWFREGLIQNSEYIQKLSEEVIKPKLGIDGILIGDTAFCINYPPHDLHIDVRDFRTDRENKKGIIGTTSVVIPVEINTINYPSFYTSNQYFYGPTTRFRNGCEDIDENDEIIEWQKSCGIYFSYDYAQDGVRNLEYNDSLTHEWWKEKIDADHWVPYSVFHGITIEKEHAWKPGNIIVFDSARLHWGSNLLKTGATYKMGISLNYGYKIE